VREIDAMTLVSETIDDLMWLGQLLRFNIWRLQVVQKHEEGLGNCFMSRVSEVASWLSRSRYSRASYKAEEAGWPDVLLQADGGRTQK